MTKPQAQDYFLIGNLHTIALVSNRGAIDWLCWPRFDSNTVFADYVDNGNSKRGNFSVASEGYQCFSQYITNTPIVETFYTKGSVAFRVRDFMPPLPSKRPGAQYLVRKIFGDAGEADIIFRFSPQLHHNAKTRLSIKKYGQVLQVAYSQGVLRLYLPKDAVIERVGGEAVIRIPVKQGDTKQVVLEFTKRGVSAYRREDLEKQTRDFWRLWVNTLNIAPFCRAELVRSAIVFKLLQYYPTGAIVSSPVVLEQGVDTDSRYVSIRDLGRTLYAMHKLGCNEEVKSLFAFIEGIVERDISAGISSWYTVDGKNVINARDKNFQTGSHISVARSGASVADPNQVVLCGSILTAYQYMVSHDYVVSTKVRSVVTRLVEVIMRNWRERDYGAWIADQKPQHYTYSKMMAWSGVQQALQMSGELSIPEARVQQWHVLEREIRHWILTYCYDSVRKTFVQHPATTIQDATNFLYAVNKFFESGDDRSVSVVRATARELVIGEVYVKRSKLDASSREEVSSLACMYWHIEAVACIGEVKEALRLFSEVGSLTPVHGLLSEYIKSDNREFIGHYPSLFAHVSYVAAAYELHRTWQVKYGVVLGVVDERKVLE